jgi:hypothetical protein
MTRVHSSDLDFVGSPEMRFVCVEKVAASGTISIGVQISSHRLSHPNFKRIIEEQFFKANIVSLPK